MSIVSTRSQAADPPDHGQTLRPGEMKLFQDLIYREAGINLPDAKASLVQGRLRKRLDVLGLHSFQEYHAHVMKAGNQEELQECLEALTTNETFFFRHKHHWDFVLGTIIPEWQQTATRTATFRAWSAASSTGEEPYSLAIALKAGLKDSKKAIVDATDINTKVLARAKAGTYGDYALQKLTPQCLKTYFHPCAKGDRHQVNDDIRAMAHFSQHNLQEPSQGAPYDLVMLRNVLIYFDAASKATVIRHMAPRIKPGGWLFLGGAETLSDSSGQFTYVRPTIYQKRSS